MSAAETVPAIARTRDWLERFVIGLSLCPFAAAPYRAGRVVYALSEGGSADVIYRDFLRALHDFVLADPVQQETALLIIEQGLESFDAYLDMLAMLEQALLAAGLEGVLQLASFHPDYLFDGVSADDPANYTNRSPYPMFHLIREDGLAAALQRYPDPEAIPRRNIERLRGLGLDGIRALLAGDQPP